VEVPDGPVAKNLRSIDVNFVGVAGAPCRQTGMRTCMHKKPYQVLVSPSFFLSAIQLCQPMTSALPLLLSRVPTVAYDLRRSLLDSFFHRRFGSLSSSTVSLSLVAHYGRNSAELRIPLRITENRPVMGFRPEFEENQKGSLRPPLVPK